VAIARCMQYLEASSDYALQLQASIAQDDELQAWATDLATEGAVSGMPRRFESVAELTDIVTNVIFICGPQHSALNFTQVLNTRLTDCSLTA
jgi:PHP family Zn ribbon phosphoesterase